MRGDEYTGASFELNADLAPLAAQQQAQSQLPEALATPGAGFVASINGQTGNATIDGGTFAGVTFSFTGGAGSIAFTVSGLGTMSTKNVAAAVANIAIADATDLPTVIALANANKTKINELLSALRTAGHLAP